MDAEYTRDSNLLSIPYFGDWKTVSEMILLTTTSVSWDWDSDWKMSLTTCERFPESFLLIDSQGKHFSLFHKVN